MDVVDGLSKRSLELSEVAINGENIEERFNDDTEDFVTSMHNQNTVRKTTVDMKLFTAGLQKIIALGDGDVFRFPFAIYVFDIVLQ